MQTSAREALLSQGALESDSFKIYCYKIVPCAKKFGHDWSECPFAHEGEKATRRCPAMYLYSSIVCPDVRQSKPCPRGDVCPYSHSIFEYWMHPARFRAQICSFGAECNRRICFFAHAQEQLRVPSEPVAADALASRAPYLQGRVAPKSRFALYPEQVPAAIPVAAGAGMQPQGALLALQQPHAELPPAAAGVQQGLPQMVYVPAGVDPAVQQPGLPTGAQLVALQQQQQQQWAAAGGGGLMYLPAAAAPSQAGAAAALGPYYLAPGAGGGGGMAGGGAVLQPAFSGPAAMQSSALQLPSPAGAGAAAYGGRQPVQLVAAVAPDGSQYPTYAVGPPGAGMVAGGAAGGLPYAQPMYAAAAPAALSPAAATAALAPQHPWGGMQQQQQGPRGGQQQPAQPQQLQQLMHVAKGGEGLGQHDGFVLQAQPPPFSAAPQHALHSVEPAGYAVLGPAGAAAAMPAPQAGARGGAQGPPAVVGGDQAAGGAASVDDIAQRMGGWRIT